jgi:alkylation response protein AidB-like acyl-CoA dehydrogenase
MFGRNGSATSVVAEAAESLSPYADQLTNDEKLRERLAAAIGAALAARGRARRQTGLRGLARRLGSDPVLRRQLTEMVLQLQAAQKRMKKNRGHKVRNAVLFVSGTGIVVAAVPSLRSELMSKFASINTTTARGGSTGSGGQGAFPQAAPSAPTS